MGTTIEAWHFLVDDRKFRYGDETKAVAGYVYSVKPPLELCGWGLHASARAIDALGYAPGAQVGRVVLSGEILSGDDKLCATHREYLWIADASETLRGFARWCALSVIDKWDAPQVVRDYLETGDESIRDAARAAAWTAAGAAAWAAARDAARAAARDAARAAARDAQNAELEARLMELAP